MDIWVISTFWFLWIVLLQTFVYMFLFEHLPLWGIYLRLGFLCHAVTMYKLLRNLHSGPSFYIPNGNVPISVSPHSPNVFLKNYYGYSGGYKVVSHCGFDLHFPNDYWHWASFHVPIGHLYIFVREMSIQVFCPFLKIGLFVFLLLNCAGNIFKFEKDI